MLFAVRVLTRQRLFPSSRLWAGQSFFHTSIQNSSYEVPKLEDHRFNVIFLGRNEFSCLVFQELHRAQDVWKGIVAVTQPDVRTGRRGEELSVSPLKELGLKLNHSICHIPARRGDFKTWVPPMPFQTSTPPLPTDFLLITASFGRILTPAMLGLFQRGRKLNVHPSLLPKYRGPAPIQWSILCEEKETGVCITEMLRKNEGEGIDGGELWGIEKIPMPKEPDYKGLIELLGVKGGQLLVSTLRSMLAGKAVSQTQPPGDKIPAPRISPDDVLLDFQTMTASHIFRIHRAIGHQRPLLTSYLSSWSPSETWNDIQLLDISLPEIIPPLASIPGNFVFNKPTRSLHVRCADGCVLSIRRVKPANGKDMSAEAFWNGLKAKACRAEKREERIPESLMILRSKILASK